MGVLLQKRYKYIPVGEERKEEKLREKAKDRERYPQDTMGEE